MFKLAAIKVFVFLVLFSCNSEASILKTGENTTDLPEILETTEIIATEASLIENDLIETPASVEITRFDETQPIDIENGSYFLLMMTILQDWNDGFMNKESDEFLQLARKLGSELVDFIDNSQETTEMNVTDFKLVEVQPSKNSLSSIYVTFVVSSKRELVGEELSSALSNRIILYGEIYEHKASIEGFMFKVISQEEAERDFGVHIICESAEKLVPLDTVIAANTTVVKDIDEIEPPAVIEEEKSCGNETIKRGSTSIYIFEGHQKCIDGVRTQISKNADEDLEVSQMLNDQPESDAELHQPQTCGKNFKRSTMDDDEVVVVIRKRGGKVFVEF